MRASSLVLLCGSTLLAQSGIASASIGSVVGSYVQASVNAYASAATAGANTGAGSASDAGLFSAMTSTGDAATLLGSHIPTATVGKTTGIAVKPSAGIPTLATASSTAMDNSTVATASGAAASSGGSDYSSSAATAAAVAPTAAGMAVNVPVAGAALAMGVGCLGLLL